MRSKSSGPSRVLQLVAITIGYALLLWVGLQPLIASVKRSEIRAVEGSGEPAEAVRAYDDLISTFPWEVSYVVAAGNWAEKKAEEAENDIAKSKFYAMALARFERAHSLQPSNKGYVKRIASLYTDWARDLDASKFSLADKWWRTAVAGEPEGWAVHRSYGVMLNAWAKQRSNDPKTYEKSLEHLLVASELDPENFDIWAYVGKTYIALSQPEKAKAALKKSLEIQPDYQEAEDLLKKLNAPSPAPTPSPRTP